jgi:hypothetical protein
MHVYEISESLLTDAIDDVLSRWELIVTLTSQEHARSVRGRHIIVASKEIENVFAKVGGSDCRVASFHAKHVAANEAACCKKCMVRAKGFVCGDVEDRTCSNSTLGRIGWGSRSWASCLRKQDLRAGYPSDQLHGDPIHPRQKFCELID